MILKTTQKMKNNEDTWLKVYFVSSHFSDEIKHPSGVLKVAENKHLFYNMFAKELAIEYEWSKM